VQDDAPITLAERGPNVGVELVQLLAESTPTIASPQGRQPALPKGIAPAQLFASAGHAPHAAQDALERWRSAGLGVRVVPVADVPQLIARLGLVGPAQQQFVNLGRARFQAARGPILDREVIALDQGELPVDRAAVRLLVRAWPVPPEASERASARARIQLELVPDVQPQRAALAPLLPSQQGDPALLTRFSLEVALTESEALVVYPLTPTPTHQPSAAPTSPSPDEPSSAPTPVIVAHSPIGPDVPALPSLADAILTDALSRPRRGVASVFFVVPHPPARYTLLPNP
jgi:hypothetical protein